MPTKRPGPECFAEYQGDDHCDICPIILVCIDATLEADGYYDELAEREEEQEQYWRYA